MKIAAASVLAALGLALAACDSGEETARRDSPPRAALVRDCRSHVEGMLDRAARRNAVVAGALWLPSARAFANHENPDPGARFVDHKTLVVVKADEEATVVVPGSERRRASLDYAYGVGPSRRRTPPVKVSDGVSLVRFVACERGTRPLSRGHPLDRETQFNGGIITRWGRCLPLDVWAGGGDRPRRVTISFGAGDCSG
jgi:hypothetical protein